jgi:chromosome segregation ATPase
MTMTNKMRRRYHDFAGEIRDLETKLAQAGAEADRRVADAVAAATAPITAERDVIAAAARLLQVALTDAGTALTDANGLIDDLHGQIVQLSRDSLNHRATIASLKAKLAKVEPTLQELDGINRRLLGFITTAGVRLRRKEQLQIDANQNRRAVTRALYIAPPEDR